MVYYTFGALLFTIIMPEEALPLLAMSEKAERNEGSGNWQKLHPDRLHSQPLRLERPLTRKPHAVTSLEDGLSAALWIVDGMTRSPSRNLSGKDQDIESSVCWKHPYTNSSR